MTARRQFSRAFYLFLLFCTSRQGLLFAASPVSEEPFKTVVVLIDRSDSVRTPETRKLYLGSLNTIMSSLKPGDALIAAWITDHSATELELPINQTFPPIVSHTRNNLLAQADRDKQLSDFQRNLQKISNEFPSLFDSVGRRKIHQTRILDSVQLAKRVFENYPAGDRILVIMSDMVEESSDANFRRDNLTQATTRQIINRLRSANRLPNLTTVKVFVVGASFPDMDRFYQIRSFWFAFFNAIGAELNDRNYGAGLIRFDP
jgi:hypothetical protein